MDDLTKRLRGMRLDGVDNATTMRLAADEIDTLKARLAEAEQLREQILNFPNLRAMREAMVAAADENKELLAKLAERDAEIAKNGRHAMRVTISQLEARLETAERGLQSVKDANAAWVVASKLWNKETEVK